MLLRRVLLSFESPVVRQCCRPWVFPLQCNSRTQTNMAAHEESPSDKREHGHRKLYDISGGYSASEQRDAFKTRTLPDSSKLVSYIADNIIGKDLTFAGPYGRRKVVYCDYTASGRSLQFIENYIQNEVLPAYGNTHTTTTVTSLQTTLFRHEARDIIRNAVNASEHDAVIFTGSGCTAAVQKLIHALQLESAPIVFVGPYEHHSNLLPWREIAKEVVRINEKEDGTVDLFDLDDKLKSFKGNGYSLVGCFAAASNITGILVDVNAITSLLHRHGALALWDYATAAPYVSVDMNPVVTGPDQGFVYKDAVFISPHKFVGGVGTPGVLVAKKRLFKNPVPSSSGGGAVFFVSRNGHRYLKQVEMREEAGTPGIVESIRAGLVFQLKENLTAEVITKREDDLTRQAILSWKNVPGLVLLGSLTSPRLPIFSFLIQHPESGLFLHHNFICAILNDVFGIQARGGCACAGPYAQDLLGIDETLAVKYEKLLLEDSRLDRTHLRRYHEYSNTEMLRPGVVRLNFSYFMTPDEVSFIVEAVKMISTEGWKLLPQYILNPETGEWRHVTHQVFKDRKWLGSVSYINGEMTYSQPVVPSVPPEPKDFHGCLQEAQKIFSSANKAASRQHLADQTTMFSEEAETLRWFLLPSEAKTHLLVSKNGNIMKRLLPFTPKIYSAPNSKDSNEVDECHGLAPSQMFLHDKSCPEPSSSYENDTIKQKEGSDNKENCPCVRKRTVAVAKAIETPLPSSTVSVVTSDNTNIHSKNKENEDSKQAPSIACIPTSQRSTDISRTQKSKPAHDACGKWQQPPKYLFKPTVQAIDDFKMVRSGDRILVCLSGGKDSLSLLHVLHQYQFLSRSKGVEFALGAMTVDPQSEAYDPSPLILYLASLGVPYFYEKQGILEQASAVPELASICSFCSRMKRGRIYACARREGYNVLALGQHLDDLSETFLMSAFHNGHLRTMKAQYTVRAGDLRVIRPFVYVREKNTRMFAEQRKLPVIPENCPACFEAPKERQRTKQVLAQQEVLFPRLFWSLRSALRPLMAIDRCGVEAEDLILHSLKNSEKDE